jgi:hypothetical protein
MLVTAPGRTWSSGTRCKRPPHRRVRSRGFL